MRIALKQIEAFLAVAEHKSFSAAARHMGVAQPALSTMIREMESELGVRMFDRTTRRVELTQAGEEFRASSSKVMEDLGHAIQNTRDLAARKRGRIRIAASPLLSSAIVPFAIAAFHKDYPGINIEVLDAPNQDIREEVVANNADCGLGTFSAHEEGIERTVLMRDNLGLFMPADHPLAGNAFVRWDDLPQWPLIAMSRNSGIRRLMELGAEQASQILHPKFEASMVTTALAFVGAGLGVAVLPTYAMSRADQYNLVSRPLVDPTVSRDLCLIRASGKSLSPAVSSFISVLRNHLQGMLLSNDHRNKI
ncbi:LysR family transcriptional regulator [Paenochrobactrum glaciei]|uniref:LysR family transcriptional regulator n=1 Tax=Paenochrobactrum glaciei TaxID=486407 RepID=A0ABN1G6Q9_9HYPH